MSFAGSRDGKNYTVTTENYMYQSKIKVERNNSRWVRFCTKFNIREWVYLPFLGYTRVYTLNHHRHEDDEFDHSKIGQQIFWSTLWERIKAIFSFSFDYFRAKPTKEQIYADDDVAPKTAEENKFSSYWVGHATNIFSIPIKKDEGKVENFTVLTDPIEGNLSKLFYPRKTRPGKKVQDYPKIDLVFISHNHRDHLDENTLKKLFKYQKEKYNDHQPIVVVPKGDKGLLEKLGFSEVHELLPGEKLDIKSIKDHNNEQDKDPYITISSVDSRHWSGRAAHDSHASAFHGCVIQSNAMDSDIYFAGDTALLSEEETKQLSENFKIAYSFQPGGPDEQRKHLESSHQSSADALIMHLRFLRDKQKDPNSNTVAKLKKAMKTIYMHTKTYKLGNLHYEDTDVCLNNMLKAVKIVSDEAQRVTEDNKKVIYKFTVTKEKSKNIDALTEYERYVLSELLDLAQQIITNSEKALTPYELAAIFESTVRIPKIGERTDLHTGVMLKNGILEGSDNLTQRDVISSEEEHSQLAKTRLENHSCSKSRETIIATNTSARPPSKGLTRTTVVVLRKDSEKIEK